MATLEKYLGSDAVEIFKQAQFLAEEESKRDPEEEPFRSRYKALELYDELNKRVKDKIAGESGDPNVLKALTGLTLCLSLQVGILYIETEELAEGEEKLMSCLKCIEENHMQEAVSLHINILNHLGILWTGRHDVDKALSFLEQSEKLFHDYKNDGGNVPQSFLEYLQAFEGGEDEVTHQRHISFESIHTHTLYYLAQVHAKKGNTVMSAQYCHSTLLRQLQENDYDPVDWALNAATLSQYYITAEQFPEARHCLASGSFIFGNHFKKVEGSCSEENGYLMSQRNADIDRCWIKYGLALLEVSRDKMLSEVNENDVEGNNSSACGSTKNDSDQKFEHFDLELTVYEEQIGVDLVRIFSSARNIFLFIVRKINDAMNYYTLDDHASDAIEIIQDHSKAFKLLAFFELDMSRQCKMHKRRIDMLSELLTELNPQHYLLVNRQLMYEIAEAYSTMVDLKITMIEMEKNQVTVHSTQKINKLIYQSIERYQEYIDSLKGGKPDLPDEFPEGDVRPALVAFFCMGRLYSKVLDPEIPRRLSMMAKSLECYKFVVDYCGKHSSAVELMPSELDICKEMVNLMPLKMQRIRSQQS